MKKLIFALTFFAFISTFGQSFEGEIIYKNSLKSKNPKMTDEQWTQMMGSKQEYFIKQGNYKSVTNGTMSQWQIYNNKENRVYTKMSNSETVLWNDASVNSDEIIKSEIKKNATTILGYNCDELTLICKSGVQKYYFSSKLPVDIKLYENHKYGNWYDFVKNSKSLTLKTIIETPQFTMETIATEVKPMKLDDKIFILPADTKISKSPY
jgi:hypothetical protein